MRVHDGSQPRTFSCLLGRNVLLMLSFHQMVSCFLLGGQPPLWAFGPLVWRSAAFLESPYTCVCPTLSSVHIPSAGMSGRWLYGDLENLKMSILPSQLVDSLYRISPRNSFVFRISEACPLDRKISKSLSSLPLESEAILSPDALYMTCFILFFSRDSYRLFASSLVFWKFVPMCRDLDPVCVHELSPFRLETSGIFSGLFAWTSVFVWLSPCLSHCFVSGACWARETPHPDTLIVFIFLYSRPRLWFALFWEIFFSKCISNLLSLLFCFLVFSFIEIQITYHKIHPFDVYSSLVL